MKCRLQSRTRLQPESLAVYDAPDLAYLEALSGYGSIKAGTILLKREDLLLILASEGYLGCPDCYATLSGGAGRIRCRVLEPGESFTVAITDA